MSTADLELSPTLTAQLFGHSSRCRAFAVLAWVGAFAGQAFAVSLVVGQSPAPPTRDLSREQAEPAPDALAQAADADGQTAAPDGTLTAVAER